LLVTIGSCFLPGSLQISWSSDQIVSNNQRKIDFSITHPAFGALWLFRPADLEADLVVMDVDDALVVGGEGLLGRGLGNLDAETVNE
jgi:hypothetical protein